MPKPPRNVVEELPLFDFRLDRPAAEAEGAAADVAPGDDVEPGEAADSEEASHRAAGAIEPALNLTLFPPEESTPPEAASPAAGVPVGERLNAGLADLAVHLAVAAAAAGAALAMGVRPTAGAALPFVLFLLAFSLLYCTVPLAFWGRTPGMAWRGHTARGPGGEPLTFAQSGKRWVAALVTVALAGLPLVVALTGRSLADRLSGSRTVAGRERGGLGAAAGDDPAPAPPQGQEPQLPSRYSKR